MALPARATVDRYRTRGVGANFYGGHWEQVGCTVEYANFDISGSEYRTRSGDGGSEGGYVGLYAFSGTYSSPWIEGCEDVEYSYTATSIYIPWWIDLSGNFTVSGGLGLVSMSGSTTEGQRCTSTYAAGGYSSDCGPVSIVVDVQFASDGGPVSRGWNSYGNAYPPYYQYSYRTRSDSVPSNLRGTVTADGVSVVPVFSVDDYWYGTNFMAHDGFLSISH